MTHTAGERERPNHCRRESRRPTRIDTSRALSTGFYLPGSGRAPLRCGVKPSFSLRCDELPTAAALVLEKS